MTAHNANNLERPFVFDKIRETSLHTDPFPHFFIENALPEDYYRELSNTFPSAANIAQVTDTNELENNKLYLKTAFDTFADESIPDVWQQFFKHHTTPEMFRVLTSYLEPQITQMHPDIERSFNNKTLPELSVGLRHPGKWSTPANQNTDIVLDCLFGMNSPVSAPTSVRGPHVDSPAKLFSALFYLRDNDDDSSGGAFQLYRLKEPIYPFRQYKKIPRKYVELVKEIPYRANTLILWLNGARSIHAVSPRSSTQQIRRYIAITGEHYGKHRKDSNFLHDPAWGGYFSKLWPSIFHK